MNLYRLLQKRADAGRPVRVGLIGAGKFGSMFLSQVPTTPGLKVVAMADLTPDRAGGVPSRRLDRGTHRSDPFRRRCRGDGRLEVEVVVEATGHAPGRYRPCAPSDPVRASTS